MLNLCGTPCKPIQTTFGHLHGTAYTGDQKRNIAKKLSKRAKSNSFYSFQYTHYLLKGTLIKNNF